jgi:hypothetical protein
MASQRRGGLIQVQVDGEILEAKGSWSYNLGRPTRESIVGADAVHGYKETPTIPFIEGEITDRSDLDIASLSTVTDATVTLQLANGKMIVLRDAFAAGEWTGNTEEGNFPARFEGKGAEEIT